MKSQNRSGSSWYTVFVSVCCLVLMVIVLLLVRQNRSLRQQLSAGPSLEVGREVRGDSERFFTSLGLVGDEGPFQIDYSRDGRQTLLLVFSKSCGACEDILPLWTELVAPISQADMRVYGVRIDQTGADQDWGPAASLPFDVYRVDRSVTREIGDIVLPSTVLLDDEGNIERVWYGMPPTGRFEGFEALVENR
jgi:hypothetical protein